VGSSGSVASWTDNIPWATINERCAVGATGGSVGYSVAAAGPGGRSPQVGFPPVPLSFDQVVIGRVPPATPGKLRYDTRSEGGGAVVMRWTLSMGATSYRIERSVSGGAFKPLVTVGRVDNYTDTTSGVVKQNPRYRIYAVNANGESAPLTLP
jgi:hypothetical protein